MPTGLLAPGLLVAALGMVLVAWGGAALIPGSLLFGAGFGTVQSGTLVLTMERVSKAEYGLGSTLWNVAFDGGVGAGAFAGGPAYLGGRFLRDIYLLRRAARGRRSPRLPRPCRARWLGSRRQY